MQMNYIPNTNNLFYDYIFQSIYTLSWRYAFKNQTNKNTLIYVLLKLKINQGRTLYIIFV